MNLTLNIDDHIVEKVRMIAQAKGTTLEAVVSDYLIQLANSDEAERERRVRLLEDSFKRMSRDMGPRNWKREDLHSR